MIGCTIKDILIDYKGRDNVEGSKWCRLMRQCDG